VGLSNVQCCDPILSVAEKLHGCSHDPTGPLSPVHSDKIAGPWCAVGNPQQPEPDQTDRPGDQPGQDGHVLWAIVGKIVEAKRKRAAQR